jgi:hypothetical protein
MFAITVFMFASNIQMQGGERESREWKTAKYKLHVAKIY